MSFTTAELFPEVRNWPALESEDEEEVYTVNLNGDEAGPEDDAVCRRNSDTQQEDTDAGFEKDVGDNICRLARPPELEAKH